MDTPFHRFHDLFAQLGLPADAGSIREFIAQHAPLPGHVALHDAPFWQPAQASFLREQTAHDADWAELIDQLNLALRQA